MKYVSKEWLDTVGEIERKTWGHTVAGTPTENEQKEREVLERETPNKKIERHTRNQKNADTIADALTAIWLVVAFAFVIGLGASVIRLVFKI